MNSSSQLQRVIECSGPVICDWSFTALDPEHSEPEYREFAECNSCGARFSSKELRDHPCSVCNSEDFQRIGLKYTGEPRNPVRSALSGEMASMRSISDVPLGVSTGAITIGLSTSELKLKNNSTSDLVLESIEMPVWVCYQGMPAHRARSMSPGQVATFQFSGHVLRPAQIQEGQISVARAPAGSQENSLSNSSIRLSFRSALGVSLVPITGIIVLMSVLISSAFLLYTMLAPDRDNFYFGLIRFSTFAAIPLFLFFYNGTGIVRSALRTATRNLSNSYRLKTKQASDQLIGFLESYPWGYAWRLLLLPLLYILVFCLSFIGFCCLSLLSLFDLWPVASIATVAYLFAALSLLRAWFCHYGIDGWLIFKKWLTQIRS